MINRGKNGLCLEPLDLVVYIQVVTFLMAIWQNFFTNFWLLLYTPLVMVVVTGDTCWLKRRSTLKLIPRVQWLPWIPTGLPKG